MPNSIFSWLNNWENFTFVMFVSFCMISLLFLLSRRMNERLEAAAPAGMLRSEASGLDQKKQLAASQPESDILGLVQSIQHGLSRLFPAGRLHSAALFLAGWLVAYGHLWIQNTRTVSLYVEASTSMEHSSQAQAATTKGFLLIALYFLLLMLPFLLVRKREFYFDVFALFLLLLLSVYKLAICWYAGCCCGIPSSWGVYNHFVETTVFPLQLFEFATGLLLSVLCILYMLFGKSYKPGRACSFCIISYAVPRFFWEFLRYHNMAAGDIFGLNMLHIISLIITAVGIAWWFILPLEKKLLDQFRLFALGCLRRLVPRHKEAA